MQPQFNFGVAAVKLPLENALQKSDRNKREKQPWLAGNRQKRDLSMTYDIRIWEQIGSTVEWKTAKLEQDIQGEIAKDRSLRGFHGFYPVPWQLQEVLKQRAESWIQRLYDPCCEARKASGGELSLEFDLAVWAYWIEPFIMREVQTTADGYRASKLMELLLCAVESTPENRRSLKVGQKDCCAAVRNKIQETWNDKLHHRPSRIEEAARTMSAGNAIPAPSARIVMGLPPEPTPTPTIATPAPPAQSPAVSTSSVVTDPSELPVREALDALDQPSLPAPAVTTPFVTPKNSAAKKWQSIEILFLSDHRIQIRVNGKSMEALNFAEFGFADGRTQNANKAWELLRVLAEERGIIRDGKAVGEDWSKVEKRIQEIRKVLREYFGLPNDPIPFVVGTGYQSLFKISCARSFHT